MKLLTRNIIAKNLGNAKIQLKCTAKELGLSARNLQERLKNEGTNYKQLLTDTRVEYAFILLGSGMYKISEVSTLLGYRDASNFIRAFKRWTNRTPTEYFNTIVNTER